MADDTPVQSDVQTSVRAWQSSATWLQRLSMRVGLERRLIFCFMAVLSAAIGVTCLVFARETNKRLGDIMGEQARQIAMALAQASEEPAREQDWDELARRAQQLIKGRNMLFVGYLDSTGQPTALATHDPSFTQASLQLRPQTIMQATEARSATFGPYLEVVAPILRAANPSASEASTKLLGYVAVGISQGREETQMRYVQLIVIGIGCLTVIGSLPVAYLLVHHIFQPIRKLVTASRLITRGDLDARVELHRPDAIGDLARSFNDMVEWVRKQQQDLANSNYRLAQANLDLEKRIEQRTAQLEAANQRLASEIAEKEEFLRAVSHDLNAPLRNISGMAAMLLMKHRDKLDEDIVHRLERIKSNVEIESDLIGELLELSRIKTRRQKMESTDVDQIVVALQDVFESDLRSRSIALFVDTPLPVLYAEKARIRQVFQNLIDNAIKYMGDGGTREIHIGCVAGASELEFYVRDTGLGIDAEDVGKVFSVFHRGKNTGAPNVAGKGVGLASVKSIVETYNGRIWVTSEPGKGSTFRFTFNGKFVMPALRADRAAALSATAAA